MVIYTYTRAHPDPPQGGSGHRSGGEPTRDRTRAHGSPLTSTNASSTRRCAPHNAQATVLLAGSGNRWGGTSVRFGGGGPNPATEREDEG